MPKKTQKSTFSNPILRADIPPLKPEYKQSKHFLYQLFVLNDLSEDTFDYAILPDAIPTSKPVLVRTSGISLRELAPAVAFIAIRNRAMQYGDVDCLFYVYIVLKKYQDGTVMSSPVVEQLKKEFGEAGKKLEEMISKGGWPKLLEVTKAEITTKRFKEELEDYDPDEFGETRLVNLEGGSDYRRPVLSMDFPRQLMRIPLVCLPVKLFNAPRPDQKDMFAHYKFDIPKPSNGIVRSAALEKQLVALKESPRADYIIWGGFKHAPTTPRAISLTNPQDSLRFVYFRQLLFLDGPKDTAALAFVIMTLVSGLKYLEIPKEAILRQLKDEYGKASVENVVKSKIKGNMYSLGDGTWIERGDIPFDFQDAAILFMNTGRIRV